MEIKEKESLKDYELIEEYKKGNNEALDILLTRYKNYIFNISYRFMHNYEDAMDLTQDVLIRVYKAIGRYEERNYFKGWLYRIISNTAINMYTKAYRRESPYLEKLDIVDDKRYNTEKEYERVYLQGKIYSASMKLKGKQRDVFILRYYENYSYKEIFIRKRKDSFMKLYEIMKFKNRIEKRKSYFELPTLPDREWQHLLSIARIEKTNDIKDYNIADKLYSFMCSKKLSFVLSIAIIVALMFSLLFSNAVNENNNTASNNRVNAPIVNISNNSFI